VRDRISCGVNHLKAVAAPLLIAVFVLVGCGSPTPRNQSEGNVLVRVDDVAITAADVDEMTRIVAWVGADSLAPRLSAPGSPAILDRLIDGALAARAADRRRISVTDAELANALARFAAFSGRPAAELTPESSAGILLRRELLSMRYWKETVTDLIEVSDLDIANYVAEHPGEAPVPAGPDTYNQLRPLIEPILARQHEQAAVAARIERFRREAHIVSTSVDPLR